ncbi:MAG: helix-turn-helix domain-containing protein [Scytonema sp. RU_4_4]|nr:helix-turn-helix domain-containing protein [Scytonema sp. RU_4_4]
MPGPRAASIQLTDIEKKALVHVLTTGDKYISIRAEALLRAEAGETNAEIGKEIEVSPGSVSGWRKKWNSSNVQAKNWEEAISKVENILGAGGGRPKKCKLSQIAKIIEINSWSEKNHRSRHAHNELIASEAIRRGIVSEISPRSIGRLLKQYEKESVVSRHL